MQTDFFRSLKDSERIILGNTFYPQKPLRQKKHKNAAEIGDLDRIGTISSQDIMVVLYTQVLSVSIARG